jgi:hypothetical protein
MEGGVLRKYHVLFRALFAMPGGSGKSATDSLLETMGGISNWKAGGECDTLDLMSIDQPNEYHLYGGQWSSFWLAAAFYIWHCLTWG